MAGKKRGRPPKKQVIIMNSQECENTNTIPPKNQLKVEIGRLGGLAKGLNRIKKGDATQIGKLDQIFNKITALLDNKERLSEASVSQLGILMGIVCDKKLLLSNRPNVLHGVVNVHEAGDRTLAALDRLTQAVKGTSPKRLEIAETIETESIPAK